MALPLLEMTCVVVVVTVMLSPGRTYPAWVLTASMVNLSALTWWLPRISATGVTRSSGLTKRQATQWCSNLDMEDILGLVICHAETISRKKAQGVMNAYSMQ